MKRLSAALVVFVCLVSPCLAGQAAEVRLSVAASLTDAVKELTGLYRQANPEVSFLANYAASGSLARQIAQGAPCDIYISANPQWLDYLVEQKLIPSGQVRTLAYNSLVVVGSPNPEILTLADLAGLTRIAIGNPKSVPAGQYAAQAIAESGLDEQLAGKLVLAQDVRQALVYADRGEVAAAFVYRSDARLARRAEILLEVPSNLHDEIRYPGGLTVSGARNPAAAAFFDFLGSDQARSVFARLGFVMR